MKLSFENRMKIYIIALGILLIVFNTLFMVNVHGIYTRNGEPVLKVYESEIINKPLITVYDVNSALIFTILQFTAVIILFLMAEDIFIYITMKMGMWGEEN